MVGQWKKSAFYFKLKKQLKAVMVALHAICLVLKMQYPTWQSAILAES